MIPYFLIKYFSHSIELSTTLFHIFWDFMFHSSYRKFSRISDTFYLLRFSLADGGWNFLKIAIKAQALWPKFAEIIN